MFATDRCLKLSGSQLWTGQEQQSLIEQLEAVETASPPVGMHYLEADGVLLQRIECFIEADPLLSQALTDGALPAAAAQLLGGPAVLHKEKINYKLPGAPGFEPHQDVAAGWGRYGQTIHLNALIAIDSTTPSNGPLEVVRGIRAPQRLSADGEAIAAEVCARFTWEIVQLQAGDVFFFDSFTPHHSGPNKSSGPRRACFCTYGLAAEGSWRARYFNDKRREFPPNAERNAGQVYVYKI